MDTLHPDVARSLRGSMIRDGIFLSVDKRKRAYLAQVAKDVGVDAKTAKEAIFGGLPRFAPELALVRLRLVRPVDLHGHELEITPYGEEAARLRRVLGDRRKL